jgi:hypothetical protein
MDFVENTSTCENVQYMSDLKNKTNSILLEEEPVVEPAIVSHASINDILRADRATRSPKYGVIVVDNFYNNAMETRDFILNQEFSVKGNYPGQRTISYANEHLREIIQKYVEPFGGKITEFPIPADSDKNNNSIYNGSFQYTTSRDRSWVHIDGFNNWAGVLYLTQDAPLSSGTAFYKFKDGATCKRDMDILNNETDTYKSSQDLTKWEQIDTVGNVFNRLVLFNANRYRTRNT